MLWHGSAFTFRATMNTASAFRRLLLPAVFLLGASLSAEPRPFTSTEGKTIQAEIVSADASSVSLKLANGQVTSLPLYRLAKDDQQYVADWIKQNPSSVSYNFETSWTKEKTSTKSGKTDATGSGGKLRVNVDPLVKFTTVTYVAHLKVTNRSRSPLQDVEAHIQVYYRDQEGKTTTIEHADSVKKIPAMKAGETLIVDSDGLGLQIKELDPRYHYTNGATNKQADSIQGVALTLMHAGKQVYEFVSPGVLKAPETPSKK